MAVKFHMIDEAYRNEWNDVVKNSPSSEIFHLFEWGELLTRTYDARIFRLAAELDGRLVGVLPFVHFGNPIFGRKLVSLPFADVGGPCTTNDSDGVCNGLVRELAKIAGRSNVDFIEVRSYWENAQCLIDVGFREGFEAFSYRLSTSTAYDGIWKKYNKKIRRNIRKMRELGLEVRDACSKSDVNNYYRIYLERMKDFGTPPAPIKFWENMWDIFYSQKMMKLIFTVLDGKPIAGFVALLFKKKLYFVLCVSLKKFWKYHGLNELLFDWYIRYASENGYEIVDFGRTRKGTGVQRFKEKGWGVERVPLNTFYLFLGGKTKNPLETALDTETNLYSRVWRRFVPTVLTPALGHVIRKTAGDV